METPKEIEELLHVIIKREGEKNTLLKLPSVEAAAVLMANGFTEKELTDKFGFSDTEVLNAIKFMEEI